MTAEELIRRLTRSQRVQIGTSIGVCHETLLRWGHGVRKRKLRSGTRAKRWYKDVKRLAHHISLLLYVLEQKKIVPGLDAEVREFIRELLIQRIVEFMVTLACDPDADDLAFPEETIEWLRPSIGELANAINSPC